MTGSREDLLVQASAKRHPIENLLVQFSVVSLVTMVILGVVLSEMLVDGVEMGANGEEVGDIASTYATNVASLRQTRKLTSSSFSFLIIPMHTAMTALLLFILTIVSTFDAKLQEVAEGIVGETSSAGAASLPGLNMFQAQDLTLTTAMITMVILVLTVSNALASKFADGGHNLKISFSLSLMCLISGVNMILVPRVGGALLAG